MIININLQYNQPTTPITWFETREFPVPWVPGQRISLRSTNQNTLIGNNLENFVSHWEWVLLGIKP